MPDDRHDARVILEQVLQGSTGRGDESIDELLARFPSAIAALAQLDARRVLELIQSIQEEKEPFEPSFVATLPHGALPRRVRATRPVVREMITQCRQSLLLLGFDITPDSGILDYLHQAAVNVDPSSFWIITDRTRGSSKSILELWPESLPRPRLFVNERHASLASLMHCKVLCVDERDLLVTSANFTAGGMCRNIEYGVKLEGRSAGQAAWDFAKHLRQIQALEEIVQQP